MRYLMILMAALLMIPTARAEQSWSIDDRLALAQCLVAETSLSAPTEQAAVAHVLIKRWNQVKIQNPVYPFADMVRSYCAVFKVKNPTPRQRWIRALPYGWLTQTPPDATEPFEVYAGKWQELLNWVDLIGYGNVKDPIPEAMHWGNLQDHRTRVRKGKLGIVRRISGTVEDVTCPGRTVRLENFYYVVIDAHPKKVRNGQKKKTASNGRARSVRV